MKTKFLPLIFVFFIATSLTGCSIKKKNVANEQTQSSAEADESIAELSNEESQDALMSEEGQEEAETTEETAATEEEASNDAVAVREDADVNPENNPVIDTSESMAEEASEEASITTQKVAGGMSEYTVQKGDTLMLIAYKVYGDYSKWRDLSETNNIAAGSVSVGSKIKYRTSMQNFPKKSAGMAYLIQDGDTLGTISEDKYGTIKKWKNIYENNRQLIKDPNLIFSGFTLFLPNLTNKVASNYIELQ
jgi:nucleoid-associated protein YgaU